MDITLVENSQYDVDRDERGEDEQRLVLERRLKCSGRTLKTTSDTGRQSDLTHRLFNGPYRVAQRDSGRHVERQCHTGELSLMIDQQQRVRGLVARHRTQWYLGSCRRPYIDLLERGWVLPVLRRNFHHDVILIEGRIQDGNLPLAERIVQRVIDELRTETESRSRAAVEDHQRL